MKPLKVLCMCPGSFTHGLDSPERGESRWSQNYAKMLALAGHDVYAASMGRPEPKEHYGVKLIHEIDVPLYGPFDLYIDSSWWKDKKPKASAKKYIILKWSLEEYTRELPLADNHYLAYPYPSHCWEFTKGVNAKKTFALPTMFGTGFPKPNWDKTHVFLPGKIDVNRAYKQYIPAVKSFLSKYPIIGTSKPFFQQEFGDDFPFDNKLSQWWDKVPFNYVMNALNTQCKLSVPILNPGAIIEAAFCGVPSIFWSHGGFYNPLSEMLDLAIGHNAEPKQFTEIAELLMNDRKRYIEATLIIQQYFTPHLQNQAIKYFDLMVETIF